MAAPLIEVRSLKMYFPVANSLFGRRRQLKAVDDGSFELYPGETFEAIPFTARILQLPLNQNSSG